MGILSKRSKEEEVTVLDSGPLDERGGASTQLTKP